MKKDMPLSYEEQLRKDCPALFGFQEAAVLGGAAAPYGRRKSVRYGTSGYSSSSNAYPNDGGPEDTSVQSPSRQRVTQQMMVQQIADHISKLPMDQLQAIYQMLKNQTP